MTAWSAGTGLTRPPYGQDTLRRLERASDGDECSYRGREQRLRIRPHRAAGAVVSKSASRVYKPLGLTVSIAGGLLTSTVFDPIWKRITGQDQTPKAGPE